MQHLHTRAQSGNVERYYRTDLAFNGRNIRKLAPFGEDAGRTRGIAVNLGGKARMIKLLLGIICVELDYPGPGSARGFI